MYLLPFPFPKPRLDISAKGINYLRIVFFFNLFQIELIETESEEVGFI